MVSRSDNGFLSPWLLPYTFFSRSNKKGNWPFERIKPKRRNLRRYRTVHNSITLTCSRFFRNHWRGKGRIKWLELRLKPRSREKLRWLGLWRNYWYGKTIQEANSKISCIITKFLSKNAHILPKVKLPILTKIKEIKTKSIKAKVKIAKLLKALKKAQVLERLIWEKKSLISKRSNDRI